MEGTRRRGRIPAAGIGSITRAAVGALVLVVAAVDVFGGLGFEPPGPVGLAVLLSEHLTLLGLLALPLAVRGPRSGVVRIALLVLVAIGLLRFGDEWLSRPGGPTGLIRSVGGPSVATWNLEVGSRSAADTVAVLAAHPADLLALQELTPDVAAAIKADTALGSRYPYRVLVPRSDPEGLGLLSSDPLGDVRFELGPARLWATVERTTRPLRVANVHPLPATIERGPLGLPVGLDTTRRDADLARIRAEIEVGRNGPPVVLVGDVNAAPTERGFADLAAGLADAHVEAGLGPGWTWRPSRLEPLGFGLLRIDVVMTDPALHATTETIACPTTGDHCLLRVDVAPERP
ncbi:MAG TPA: endonuclease/exonuclease/phosphatase family protein [Candidatus Limnocylindrales bacterium]|nr:endonuclease/exonuclease/phosphatase family protein [Candidatus Limnocylindrales bacterium]